MKSLKKNKKKVSRALNKIYPYEDFISILKEKALHFNEESRAVIISAELKGYEYVTETMGVEGRREVIKFYEKIIIGNRKNLIGAAKTYGDNFIIVDLIDKNLSERELIEQNSEAIQSFYEEAKKNFPDISLSIVLGLNIIEGRCRNVVQELDNANYARQIAKQKMIDIVVFSKEILEEQRKRMRYIQEFNSALKNKEFQVFYQPKVDSLYYNIIGGEALIRWKKPDGTMIWPDEFISLFEKNGYIVRLDYYVYNHVFKYISDRISKGKHCVPISMNVSRVHMYDNRLVQYIKKLLDKYKTPAKYLEFEITEDVCILEKENTLSFILEMKKLGIKISMDDFGSGYSSLNLLSEVPIDVLKVDKEFLNNWEEFPNKKIVIESILAMARRLHISVVSEGVEYKEQSRYLGLAGCEILQGYYFSKPICEEEFNDYVNSHKNIKRDLYRFSFDETLLDDSGIYEGTILGDKVSFVKDIAKNRSVLYFPSGDPGLEVIELPKVSYFNGDFSISVWIKIERKNIWTSIFYIDFENVFLSIMPIGRDEKLVFRVKEKEYQEGWNDILSEERIDNTWTYVVASYSRERKSMALFVNGMLSKSIELKTEPLIINRVLVGGDIYQKSFQGYMGELKIYNYPLSINEIEEKYYEQKKDFKD